MSVGIVYTENKERAQTSYNSYRRPLLVLLVWTLYRQRFPAPRSARDKNQILCITVPSTNAIILGRNFVVLSYLLALFFVGCFCVQFHLRGPQVLHVVGVSCIESWSHQIHLLLNQ